VTTKGKILNEFFPLNKQLGKFVNVQEKKKYKILLTCCIVIYKEPNYEFSMFKVRWICEQ
jgi:hypothetical protein